MMIDLVRCQGRRGFLTLGLALLGLSLGSRRADAELIVGLTTDNRLVTFDSSTPGSATTPVSVTGLEAGDALVGIDRRPLNGVLYALGIQGTVGRLYTIVESTGVATLASTLSVALGGGSFGIDFNPVVDRLRVVSNLDQNLRINVDTGVTLVDGVLAYAVGDPNFNADPSIVAVAYSNNFRGATTTVLRDLDSELDILATQAPPNAGTLNTQFPLGVNFDLQTGYDISGLTGTPYASLNVPGASATGFYTLSAAGAALVDLIGTPGGAAYTIRDIAAPVGFPVPEPSSLAMLGIGGLCCLGYARRLRGQGTRVVSE